MWHLASTIIQFQNSIHFNNKFQLISFSQNETRFINLIKNSINVQILFDCTEDFWESYLEWIAEFSIFNQSNINDFFREQKSEFLRIRG